MRSNVSQLDKEIWDEFFSNWGKLSYGSEKLLANRKKKTVERLFNIHEIDLPKEGKTRERLVKIRVNQSFFRSAVLAAYNNTCCITGLQRSELLIAGHIKPWAVDEKNRLNPRNGIAMNALHDRAFEAGLMTITPDFKIKISSLLKRIRTDSVQEYFKKYEGHSLILPSRFLPDPELLEYHNKERFKA